MTKEEIIEFLTENLTIELDLSHHGALFGSSPYIEVEVKLKLEKETISYSSGIFDIPSNN